MLELLVVYWLSLRLRRMARIKGHTNLGRYGALALLWFAGEIVFAFVAALGGVQDLNRLYIIALLGALAGGGVAWWKVSTAEPAPGWHPGMRMAGWCRKCKKNVWVRADGKCENGHSETALSKLYIPQGQMGPEPPTTDAPPPQV
jgi:hypothetical protein